MPTPVYQGLPKKSLKYITMKIIEPGHIYDLANIDGECYNRLTFVKRDNPPEKYPGNVGHHPGTQCQEVCRVLIDRLRYLDNQIPCNETEMALVKAREIILLLEMRNARKNGYTLDPVSHPEMQKTCPTCGHIYCREHDNQ